MILNTFTQTVFDKTNKINKTACQKRKCEYLIMVPAPIYTSATSFASE